MNSPKLICITGLPATGKTTLARAYAERYKAVHLSSDQVRTELGLRGHYTPEAKRRVYDELLARVRNALEAGRDVVVDSVLPREALRKPFQEVAAACGATSWWVHLKISDATARTRLSRPRTDSEATFDVYEKLQEEWEVISVPHLCLQADTSSVEDLLRSLRQYISQRNSC
ncbi:MAG: AAA family ATPase [Saprospiraceae bacterium]|nr:AAA family ATPase [Saprospiraceae bacterium]MDW8483511.1 AAA family ATPase [Saprospiraceae bacterium]